MATAETIAKLGMTIAEAMRLSSHQKATANWKQAQEETGMTNENLKSVDDDMDIRLDSPTIHNHYHNNDEGSESQRQPKSSPLGTVAKLALGAALVGSGAGAGYGIPLLMSGGKDVVNNITNEAAAPGAQADRQYSLTLGDPTE